MLVDRVRLSLTLAFLASTACCTWAADLEAGSLETIYKSKTIVDYGNNSLSPDGSKLVVREWSRDAGSGLLSQTIKIIAIEHRKVLSTARFSSKDKSGTGLVDLGRMSWNTHSSAVFFSTLGSAERVYKLNVATGKSEEILRTISPVTRVSVSPDDSYIAYVEQNADASGRLMIHTLAGGQTIEADQQVSYLAPAWRNASKIAYAKEGGIWEYDLGIQSGRKLAELPTDEASYIQSSINNQLYLISNMRVDSENPFITVRTLWQFDLATGQKKKLIAFQTASSGIAFGDAVVVFPLSVMYESSELVLYDLAQGLVRQLPTRSGKNDLPLLVNSKRQVLFRSNNKEILATQY